MVLIHSQGMLLTRPFTNTHPCHLDEHWAVCLLSPVPLLSSHNSTPFFITVPGQSAILSGSVLSPQDMQGDMPGGRMPLKVVLLAAGSPIQLMESGL